MLYGNLNKVIQIVGGLTGSAEVLAVVPAIPVFIAAISVAPVVVGVITNVTKINKETILKSHHRKYNVMLSNVQIENTLTDKQLFEEVFRQLTNIHSTVDYIEPLELYRRYKLNWYDIEEDEKLQTNKSFKDLS